jgi:O-antigen biosynthesis protein
MVVDTGKMRAAKMFVARFVPGRVRSWLRGQWRRFRREEFALHPIGQLIQLAAQEKTWRSTGRDPKFACGTRNYPLKAGWYCLSVDLEMLDGDRLLPVIYFDFGHGMHEAWAANLNFVRLGAKRHKGIVLLPHDVYNMRFDPADAPCTFQVDRLALRPITRVGAALGMLYSLCLCVADTRKLLVESVRRLCGPNGRRSFAIWLHGLYMRSSEMPSPYDTWLDLYDKAVAVTPENSKMLVSVLLPVYNPPEKWLRCCLDSVLDQTYSNWELCVADDASTQAHVRKVLEEYGARDPRIRVTWRARNGHVSAASNTALSMAKGEFVALLDHDDELHPEALSTIVYALQKKPHWLMAYSDEDKIDENSRRYDPYFKPDWNPDLLYGQNCVSHLGVYARSLLNDIGGFREGFEGSQDWDVALRCSERLRPEQIGHIPRVLYHWRAIPGSTAQGVDQKGYAHGAGLRALREHFLRLGSMADVMEIDGMLGVFRVRHPLPDTHPLVSIIVPTRDKVDLLRKCVGSILSRTTYSSFEIVIVDNQSCEPDAVAYLDSLEAHPSIQVLKHDQPFNYSRINNEAVDKCKGELICLLNNDIEVITADWLEELVSHALRPHVGAVGAMLYYPNDTIQHAGVIVGMHGVAAHPYSGMPRGYHGQMARARLTQAMSAVTAACLLVRRDAFEKIGGFDVTLQVAFNDIDFCLRLRQHGYVNIWTPFAELYHWESASRGAEDTPEKLRRFEQEVDLMMRRWRLQLNEDPYYNPNLTLSGEPFALAFPPRDDAFAVRNGLAEHRSEHFASQQVMPSSA